MKRDRKFAKNRKCNDPMNFKGGSTRRSFNDGSRLWKLFPEQLEITRLLAVKRCSTINSLISKSRIPNYEYVKFKRVFFRFVRRDGWKEVREKYPLSCFSIVDSIERARNSKRILDSTRNAWAVSHPVKTIPLSLPDFCLNYPRFEASKRDSRACNETLFLALRFPTRVHCHP